MQQGLPRPKCEPSVVGKIHSLVQSCCFDQPVGFQNRAYIRGHKVQASNKHRRSDFIDKISVSMKDVLVLIETEHVWAENC